MAEEVVGIRLALRDRAATQRGVEDVAGGVDEIGDAAVRSTKKSRGLLDVLGRVGGATVRTAKIGAAGLVGLGIAGVVAGTKIAAGNEQADISFTTMLGSATRAKAFIKDLAVFAAKTPFDFPGLQKSSSALISAGIGADKVIPIMTTLGNATAGMGTGAEGISRATTALQQMIAAQKISAEDLNQLRDAGVPVYDLLASATGKSVAQVAELVDKGKLGRKELDQLLKALASGKGLERFNGLMEKQSASLTGMWSSFADTVAMGLGRVLAPWGPTMKIALGEAQTAAGPLFDRLEEGSRNLARRGPWAVRQVKNALSEAAPVIGKVYDGVKGFVSELRGGEGVDMDAVRTLASSSATLVTNLPALGAQMPSVNDGLRVAGVVTGFLADHLDTLAYLMPVIAAGFVLYKAGQTASNVASAVSVPLQWSQVAATISLAASNRALAAAQLQTTAATTGSTVAENVGFLTRARMTAATVASAAASGIARAATIAWTGVQWLLNAAMTANPIGLVVAGIALLVGGFVLAYKKSETFRDAIGWVWEKLQGLWDMAKKVGGVIADLFKYTPIGQIISVAKGDGLNVPQLPGRATGGPVNAGQPYVVGEKRPEVFIPRQSGTIVPSVEQFDDLKGSLQGAVTVHNHVYLDGKQVTQSVVKGVRRDIARR